MFCELFTNYDLKCHCCHILCVCSAENSSYASVDNTNNHILDINKYSMFNMVSTSCKSLHVHWYSPCDHNNLFTMYVHHNHFTMDIHSSWSVHHIKVSRSYLILFFWQNPILSYFLGKCPILSYFLAILPLILVFYSLYHHYFNQEHSFKIF